jgi:hypothetical protein
VTFWCACQPEGLLVRHRPGRRGGRQGAAFEDEFGDLAGVVAALSFGQTVLSDFLQVLFTAIPVGVAAAIVVAVFQQ